MSRTSPPVAVALMLALAPGIALAAPGAPPVFPMKVAPKYASQSAGQARLHTCLDQYKANKASGANGGMTWIQKGGGYYSACSKRLRG